jgi:alpha-mannosidase
MLQLPIRLPGLYRKLLRIRTRIYTELRPLRAEILTSPEPIPFAELDRGAFRPLRPGTRWGKPFDCAWLRVTGPAPPRDGVILLGIRGEGLVCSADGTPVDSVSTVWQLGDLPHGGGKYRDIPCPPGGTVELYTDVTYNGFLLYERGRPRYHGAYTARRDPAVHSYYYDFLTLTVYAASTGDRERKRRLQNALNRSYAHFASGDTAAARAELAALLKDPSQSEFCYSAVGHGHLDMAWLWPLRETRRKAARTYIKALRNLERYDGFVYGTSQPQQLLWMKREYPGLYREIQRAVADGRMELQGAFWVECDTNLPGGESLARQALFGRAFLREEFGQQDIRLCWLPDAFGFSGSLPQILKKSGMDWFSTIKLQWNKVNVFPHRTFYWQGIDGSKVLAHIPPEGDYNSRAAADGLLNGLARYPEQALNTALLVYGSGDGGGGPGEVHLELLRRERSLEGLPQVRQESADSFFRRLETKDIPHTHVGELYLETHQGTYTTQSRIKYYNRLLERKLHDAEALSVLTGTDCREALREPWRTLLLHQFHDIRPGSSIARVNAEAAAAYADLERELDGYIDGLTAKLPPGDKLSALNLTGFPRAEYVRAGETWYRANAAPYAAAALQPAGQFPELSFTADTLSNGLLTLRFAPDGEIVSCRDAEGGEHAAGGLNRLQLYRDPYQFPFDAWDMDRQYHTKRPRKLKMRYAGTRADGPVLIRRHSYAEAGLAIEQEILLEAGSDVVRFATTVRWHKTHRMLRAEFCPAHYGPAARCEIQFGHIERPTTENGSVETAQFEVCAHKWLAVSDERAGFALLNDCKYGHRAKNGQISLNLLRAPTFPDKTADRGEHRFTYAFCPFPADKLGKVIREAYRLNNPLRVCAAAFDSVVAADDPGVVIETLKPAESGSGTVLRLYESLGTERETALRTSLPHTRACETDLLERDLGPVDLRALRFGAFEIKTIRLEG